MEDKNEGHGGSYLIDKNGKRKLIERTAEKSIENNQAADYTGTADKTDEVKNAEAD